MTVRELLARVDSDELSEWMAYERITGPLDVAAHVDIGAAQIAAVLVNLQRGKGKRAKELGDFLIKWDRPPKQEQTPEQMLALVRGLNRRLGGTTTRTT